MQRAGARRPIYRSDPARCITGRCVCLLSCKLLRREIANARMRTHLIIVPPPCLDDHLRFRTRAEPFEPEAFIAELAVEAFGDAVLPGLARLDQRGADPLRNDPRQQSLGDELWTVVAAQEGRRPALADQTRRSPAPSGCGRPPGPPGPPW